jgi:hypothetical protein
LLIFSFLSVSVGVSFGSPFGFRLYVEAALQPLEEGSVGVFLAFFVANAFFLIPFSA